MEALGALMVEIFNAWNTPIEMPFIGWTSFFWMEMYLLLLGMFVWFITRLFGGKSDD